MGIEKEEIWGWEVKVQLFYNILKWCVSGVCKNHYLLLFVTCWLSVLFRVF
jgi:hypothetical protein